LRNPQIRDIKYSEHSLIHLGDFVRKAKAGPTVNEKHFLFAGGDKRLPRAEVTVDGYFFSFTCNKNLTPVIVVDTHAHGTIKAKAYAVAAELFKTEMRAESASTDRQSKLF
jgi:hypothetical protein